MEVRLGKKDYKFDKRTLRMANFMRVERIAAPPTFDLDKKRAPFPLGPWGNDAWGNCVVAGRANHLLRFERIEARRTLKLRDDQVITKYKELSGAMSPGDAHDEGLVVLDTLNDWRRNGWNLSFGNTTRNYSVAAFAEIDPYDPQLVRDAIYLFHGVQLGFSLPRSAMEQTRHGYWDVVKPDSSLTEPGSWGGHLVYAKRYDEENVYVLSWGIEVKVSNAFMDEYCDEAWGVVDNLDSWGRSKVFVVDDMVNELKQIGAIQS